MYYMNEKILPFGVLVFGLAVLGWMVYGMENDTANRKQCTALCESVGQYYNTVRGKNCYCRLIGQTFQFPSD